VFVISKVEFTQPHRGVSKRGGISSDVVSTYKEQFWPQDFPIPHHKKPAPEVREHLLSSFFCHSEENGCFATPEISISVFNVWFDTSCSPDFPPLVLHTEHNSMVEDTSQIEERVVSDEA